MDTLVIDHDNEFDDSSGGYLPGRPRRRLLNRVTVPLLGLLLAAAGFLVGIEVEKGHGSPGTTSAARGSLRSGASGFPGFGGGSASRTAGGSSTARRSGFPGRSGFSPGGFGATSGGATIGTVSSVSGKTIDVKTVSGNTIKVTLTSATKLKKQLSVSRNSIHPGDSITVEGISGKGGAITASSISDSGSSGS